MTRTACGNARRRQQPTRSASIVDPEAPLAGPAGVATARYLGGPGATYGPPRLPPLPLGLPRDPYDLRQRSTVAAPYALWQLPIL